MVMQPPISKMRGGGVVGEAHALSPSPQKMPRVYPLRDPEMARVIKPFSFISSLEPLRQQRLCSHSGAAPLEEPKSASSGLHAIHIDISDEIGHFWMLQMGLSSGFWLSERLHVMPRKATSLRHLP